MKIPDIVFRRGKATKNYVRFESEDPKIVGQIYLPLADAEGIQEIVVEIETDRA